MVAVCALTAATGAEGTAKALTDMKGFVTECSKMTWVSKDGKTTATATTAHKGLVTGDAVDVTLTYLDDEKKSDFSYMALVGVGNVLVTVQQEKVGGEKAAATLAQKVAEAVKADMAKG